MPPYVYQGEAVLRGGRMSAPATVIAPVCWQRLRQTTRRADVLSSLLANSRVAAALFVRPGRPYNRASVVLFGFSVTAPLPELIAAVSAISSAISATELLVVVMLPPFCVIVLSVPITSASLPPERRYYR